MNEVFYLITQLLLGMMAGINIVLTTRNSILEKEVTHLKDINFELHRDLFLERKHK